MRRIGAGSTIRRMSAALMAVVLALLFTAGPAAASSVTFGLGSATSTFGQSIDFRQPYSGGAIKSAAVLIKLPWQAGPYEAPLASPGSSLLKFTLNTSTGSLYPFTPVVANFEVTFADGTTQTGPDIKVVYTDDRFTWKVKTGKVVRLHYIDASDSFAQNLVTWADDGIKSAADLFGIVESKPVDYYVYPSQSVFQQGLSQPSTVIGLTLSSYRTCYGLVAPGDAATGQSVMPHEMTHIAFSDATDNAYHSPPRWLDEGLAVYNSDGYDSYYRGLVSRAVRDGTLRSLLSLTDFFPSDSSRVFLAYGEGVSAVDFMIRKYGRPAVQKLVQAYAKGVTDDEAFTAGLGVDQAAFDSAWLADNGVTQTKYGPQPAPTGPLPPGWNGSPLGPGATPSGGAIPSSLTSSGTGSGSAGEAADTAVLVLAGIMAAAGVMLLLAAAYMLLAPNARANH